MLKYLLFGFCGFTSAVFTFLTTWDLFLFLSANRDGRLFTARTASRASFGLHMIENIIFISIFIISHSLLAGSYMKNLFVTCGIAPIHRSLYNLITCFTLQLIMKNWVRAPTNLEEMWNLNNQHFVVLMQSLQLFSWLLACSIIYILDFSEFIGCKQISYHYEQLGCPMSTKTTSAQEFYQNCRHPFLVCALFILWSVPSMTFDRFLLASVFTLYMCEMMGTSERSYSYVKYMYNRKITTIENNKTKITPENDKTAQ